MKEIKCPNCGSVLTVNDADYASIVSQVKNAEFNEEIERRMAEISEMKDVEQKASMAEADKAFNLKLNEKQQAITEKDNEIARLKDQITGLQNSMDLEIKAAVSDKEQEITSLKAVIGQNTSKLKIAILEEQQKAKEALQRKDMEISELKAQARLDKSEAEVRENGIKEQYEDKLKEIAGRPFERGVFLGSGAMKGIAEECHLKLQELTDGAVVCKFDSFLGFRHGPKAVVNSKSIVVYLMTEQEDVQRYERDLVKQVDANNTPVAQIIVIAGKAPELPGVKADLVVKMPYGPKENDFYGIVAYVLVGQLLGYYAALAHGLNPDAPSVSGNIHRVVEGVTIYE
jgi:hypothetical protein